MTGAMAEGVPQADGSLRPEPRMHVDDVARAVAYMASLPLDANVATLTVMATKMPYHRPRLIAGSKVWAQPRKKLLTTI